MATLYSFTCVTADGREWPCQRYEAALLNRLCDGMMLPVAPADVRVGDVLQLSLENRLVLATVKDGAFHAGASGWQPISGSVFKLRMRCRPQQGPAFDWELPVEQQVAVFDTGVQQAVYVRADSTTAGNIVWHPPTAQYVTIS